MWKESGKVNLRRLCILLKCNGRTSTAALVCGIVRVKAIEDMSREGIFSSFATQLCLQKFKKIKINMNFLKRVKQCWGAL